MDFLQVFFFDERRVMDHLDDGSAFIVILIGLSPRVDGGQSEDGDAGKESVGRGGWC